ncbi:MAG: hypothetical protein N2235_05365 [Fischerella sp.]|nr:hypothetical protein [Fischerella sp.]
MVSRTPVTNFIDGAGYITFVNGCAMPRGVASVIFGNFFYGIRPGNNLRETVEAEYSTFKTKFNLEKNFDDLYSEIYSYLIEIFYSEISNDDKHIMFNWLGFGGN